MDHKKALLYFMTGVEKNNRLKMFSFGDEKKVNFSIIVGVLLCLLVGFLAGQITQTMLLVNSWYPT